MALASARPLASTIGRTPRVAAREQPICRVLQPPGEAERRPAHILGRRLCPQEHFHRLHGAFGRDLVLAGLLGQNPPSLGEALLQFRVGGGEQAGRLLRFAGVQRRLLLRPADHRPERLRNLPSKVIDLRLCMPPGRRHLNQDPSRCTSSQ